LGEKHQLEQIAYSLDQFDVLGRFEVASNDDCVAIVADLNQLLFSVAPQLFAEVAQIIQHHSILIRGGFQKLVDCGQPLLDDDPLMFG